MHRYQFTASCSGVARYLVWCEPVCVCVWGGGGGGVGGGGGGEGGSDPLQLV